jgi:hypothetical protein
MGTVDDALDNAVAESFFATLQTELLDRRRWSSRRQLAQAIFEWIEVFYNALRRHSTLGMLAPLTYATATQPIREADHLPVPGVDHHRQIDPAVVGRMLGDVRDPQLVGPVRPELAGHQIIRSGPRWRPFW